MPPRAKKPVIYAEVPPELKAAFEAYASGRGLTQTAATITILETVLYAGRSTGDPASSDREVLHQLVDELADADVSPLVAVARRLVVGAETRAVLADPEAMADLADRSTAVGGIEEIGELVAARIRGEPGPG